MLDDPTVQAWNRDDDYMPYWAYLWPGAVLLSEAVAREPWPDDRAVEALEIGCGIGLTGLVALGRGLRVCFSDYDPAALEFVERNAARNGFEPSRYSTRILDWREPANATYPVILGSDVLYEHRLVPLVVNLLATMLAPRGLALIACPGRASAEGFPELLAARGLSCRAEPLTAAGEHGQPIRGLVYRVREESGASGP
jgi:predicted nicotinamide N-methyase